MSEELLQYEVLKPISFKGDRIEKGSIIRMTPEEAENIGDEFLQLVEETSNADAPAESTEPKEPEKESEDSEKGEGTDTDEDKKSSEENTEGTQTDTNTDENL